MKLTIRFKHSDSSLWPCAAIVDIDETRNVLCATGKTWAEAEAEAIAKAKAQLNAGPPPLERIIEL